jgi:hypothetical protein
MVSWYLRALECTNSEIRRSGCGYYEHITRVTAQQLIELADLTMPHITTALDGKCIKALDTQVNKNVAELKELLQRMINCDIVKYVLGGNTYHEDIQYYSIDGTNISVSALTKLLAIMGETHE